MEVFSGSCFMLNLQEFSMDTDILSLSQASRGVRRDVALHAEISFEASSGTMTWSEDGISGLCRFYPLSKLGKCLRELGVGNRRLDKLRCSRGRGQIEMHKEEGFGQSLQSMQCSYLMESSDNMPFCKWLLAHGERCVCHFISNSPRGQVKHHSGCKAVEYSEGYMLTLLTLSNLYFYLQGEIIIDGQKGFNMWHEILHEVEGPPRHEGPVLCRSFEFDQESARAMMKHQWEGDFPTKCTSELVELYLEPHGECGVEVSFELVEEGLVAYVWLSKKTGDDEDEFQYEYIDRPTPPPRLGQERVDMSQVCGEIGVYNPETSSFTILDPFHYFVTTEDDVAHDVAWLPAGSDLYPYVCDALISGRPLPMFFSHFEQA